MACLPTTLIFLPLWIGWIVTFISAYNDVDTFIARVLSPMNKIYDFSRVMLLRPDSKILVSLYARKRPREAISIIYPAVVF
jgi:hypothetical protein